MRSQPTNHPLKSIQVKIANVLSLLVPILPILLLEKFSIFSKFPLFSPFSFFSFVSFKSIPLAVPFRLRCVTIILYIYSHFAHINVIWLSIFGGWKGNQRPCERNGEPAASEKDAIECSKGAYIALYLALQRVVWRDGPRSSQKMQRVVSPVATCCIGCSFLWNASFYGASLPYFPQGIGSESCFLRYFCSIDKSAIEI